jgi:chromosome segregation ATPase
VYNTLHISKAVDTLYEYIEGGYNMIKGKALLLLFLAATVLVLISCASSIKVEEFDAYQQQTQESIESLVKQIDDTKKELATLNSSFTQLQKEQNLLEQEVIILQEQFSNLDSDLSELVILAGYDSSNDFIDFARDIVMVNENYKIINNKIELLKEAMAIFVNE